MAPMKSSCRLGTCFASGQLIGSSLHPIHELLGLGLLDLFFTFFPFSSPGAPASPAWVTSSSVAPMVFSISTTIAIPAGPHCHRSMLWVTTHCRLRLWGEGQVIRWPRFGLCAQHHTLVVLLLVTLGCPPFCKELQDATANPGASLTGHLTTKQRHHLPYSHRFVLITLSFFQEKPPLFLRQVVCHSCVILVDHLVASAHMASFTVHPSFDCSSN